MNVDEFIAKWQPSGGNERANTQLFVTDLAEDTGLIPKKSFSALLKKVRDRPENLPPMLADLWAKMDTGGFVGALGEAGETVRRFNGYLFKETSAIPLEVEEIDVLIAAASADWRQVEPAIFGRLLERALNPKERAKLGAHYTPRTYVERLVGPTIMEPLRDDWSGARTAATQAAEAGDEDGARKIVETFHGKLARTKVLDPACGTGNFLYVSMARMKELEGEVLELLEELGDDQYIAEISGHTITPENFLGIEINPRAANIAQLVLWIGYLQWHFRVNGEDRMPEAPVLRDVKTIENRDALITWDKRELERDQYGKPVTRWDGETMKKHPVTGKDVPDEAARVEVYRYVNPQAAKWPKADFIIGNPPFIGNKRMRERLGSSYVDALRRSHRGIAGSVDLVMFWWDIAARKLSRHEVRRFGLITTGKIAQPLNRGPVERLLNDSQSSSLALAIPDHPWWDDQTAAAVRVGFTVATTGKHRGLALELPRSIRRKKDVSPSDFVALPGVINSDLSVGPDLPSTAQLQANEGISQQGVILIGDGFRTTADEAQRLGMLAAPYRPYLKKYIIGEDLTERPSQMLVVDTFGMSEADLQKLPVLFQFLEERVLPERRTNEDRAFREKWWLWGRPRPLMRSQLPQLSRYIATPRTSTHRTFQFQPTEVVPDTQVVFIGLDEGFCLGVLSSRLHVVWANRIGGWKGAGNDSQYNHSRTANFLNFRRRSAWPGGRSASRRRARPHPRRHEWHV